MQKNYCMWKDEEVKKLFSHIEECSRKKMALTKAFQLYAQMSGRKPNSVRNYYYAELNELEHNQERAQRLGIDLKLHTKSKPKFFTEEEVRLQIGEIIKLKNFGYSVRKACLKIAGNNLEEMVRLQNKYRTLLKNNPEFLKELENEVAKKDLQTKELPNNIVQIPKKKTRLTESEINSLFLGLVKLVKNTAKQEATEYIKEETQLANNALRQALVQLSNKEQELQEIKRSFELLKTEKELLDETVKVLRGENAKFYAKLQSKNNKLKEYTSKMTSQQKKSVKA